ncbi:MAG: hypothetical protein PHV06_10965, partial [bacterium]|nr:hypothetical protein [bacterium]
LLSNWDYDVSIIISGSRYWSEVRIDFEKKNGERKSIFGNLDNTYGIIYWRSEKNNSKSNQDDTELNELNELIHSKSEIRKITKLQMKSNAQMRFNEAIVSLITK